MAGDCFDLGFINQRTAYLVVIDVTGHDATAALTALKAKSQLRAGLKSGASFPPLANGRTSGTEMVPSGRRIEIKSPSDCTPVLSRTRGPVRPVEERDAESLAAERFVTAPTGYVLSARMAYRSSKQEDNP